jgi:phage tail tape-measure protein
MVSEAACAAVHPASSAAQLIRRTAPAPIRSQRWKLAGAMPSLERVTSVVVYSMAFGKSS